MIKLNIRSRVRGFFSFQGFTSSLWQYIIASVIVILWSAFCLQLNSYLGYQSVSFLMIFMVSLLAIFVGIGPILLSAALSAFLWDFFFIPTKYTIWIVKTEDQLMFITFFIIAIVNSVLIYRVRHQEELTGKREEQTNALYQLTKQITDAGTMFEMIDIAVKEIKRNFGFDVIFVLQDGKEHLVEYCGSGGEKNLSAEEMNMAEWVYNHSLMSEKTSETFPSNKFIFYPLTGSSVKPGVMAVRTNGAPGMKRDEFWYTFLTQISNAIEREFLDDLARRARFLDESDKLYKTLFNSISHELRIPVSAIMGAAETLSSFNHTAEIRNELYTEIFKASGRLNRLIENLLNMSRLESGRISPRPDWYDLNDLINVVSENLQDELRNFHLEVDVPDDIPLIKMDFGLMEQVLQNLVYNATQYAPPSSNIRIRAFYIEGMMTLQVLDRGNGFPPDKIDMIFNKFFRIEGSKAGGTGLGLSIAKGFVEAHKGTISVANRQNGGAVFTISIPSATPEIDFRSK